MTRNPDEDKIFWDHSYCRMKRFLPFLLMGLGVALLFAGLVDWRYNTLLENPTPAALPEQILDLPLVNKVTGRQAASEIAALHRKDFPLSSAAVGIYGQEHQVTLWISGSPVGLMAERMVAAMQDRIARGNSPFTPLGERAQGSRRIYELEGIGQRHFYFQSGKNVVWLAARTEVAEPALDQLLKFYP